MRIIAGKFRGRRLECPKLVTRPTLDRVREALFSILGDLSEAKVVDFYAGSGALGLEALSRGASHITLVEGDRQAAKVIRKNVEGWGIEGAYRVVECSVEKSRGPLTAAAPFDLVLADPPWKIAGEAAVIVPQVVKGLLSPSAIVVLGHASRDELAVEADSGLERYDRRTWGDSALSFSGGKPEASRLPVEPDMSMQSPSLPPEIPKRSLAPVWIAAGAVLAIGGGSWALLARSSQKQAEPEPAAPSAPAIAAKPAPAPAIAAAEPPPPPPPPEHAPPPPPTRVIPAEATAALAAPTPRSAPMRRDPNCDDPCKGKETPELLGALRAKAGQARSCYERALSNNGALSGKLEVAVRVGATGAACSASVANDTLGDASVKSCALARFRGSKYPKPTGGCVDISVPMNFMPAGSR